MGAWYRPSMRPIGPSVGPLLWLCLRLGLCLAFACAEEARPEPRIVGRLVGRTAEESGPPRAPVRRARAEERGSSWREELMVVVSPPPAPSADCPDADQDGFPSAAACPGADPQSLDCDDADPAVTPATERAVPAGPFLMGSVSPMASADEGPVSVVELGPWCLDVTEVRARDYRAWLGDRRPAGGAARRPAADGSLPSAEERLPAEGVTWREATDYCAARGQVLPSEAAWEKAARGGCERGSDPGHCEPSDFRPYPWGAAGPSCEAANHCLIEGGEPLLCVGGAVAVDEDSRGPGPYGHLHLAGNVWEHVADVYSPSVYAASGRVDPVGPAHGEVHTLRGGGWDSPSSSLRVSQRVPDLVPERPTGFRCARSFAEGRVDAAPPLALVTWSGVVEAVPRGEGPLRVVAYPAMDAPDPDEPVASALVQRGAFSLQVPAGGDLTLRLLGPDGPRGPRGAAIAAVPRSDLVARWEPPLAMREATR